MPDPISQMLYRAIVLFKVWYRKIKNGFLIFFVIACFFMYYLCESITNLL